MRAAEEVELKEASRPEDSPSQEALLLL